jgi:putative restriction endonuclease
MAYFGEIKGIPEGTIFTGLSEAVSMGLIANKFKGISSGDDSEGIHGADAIVMNGGYEFDRDEGETIIYTGDGGNRPGSLEIVMDQKLTGRNKALVESFEKRLPVRLIRGAKLESIYAPKKGYRYDGLFYVSYTTDDLTPKGHVIYQFTLEKAMNSSEGETQERFPTRKTAVSQRLVRDTEAARRVKMLHKNTCQVCGHRLEVFRQKYYSEGAHIRPLGKPHEGPDIGANILCLCPNHHVQFDRCQFSINPETLELVGIPGKLRTVPGHVVSAKYLKYHLKQYDDYITGPS